MGFDSDLWVTQTTLKAYTNPINTSPSKPANLTTFIIGKVNSFPQKTEQFQRKQNKRMRKGKKSENFMGFESDLWWVTKQP